MFSLHFQNVFHSIASRVCPLLFHYSVCAYPSVILSLRVMAHHVNEIQWTFLFAAQYLSLPKIITPLRS